jgi:hypothetical protein
MSTEETTVIDDKKAVEEGTTTEKADWAGFFSNFGISLTTGIIISISIMGSVGLFLAKVSSANILPINFDMAPYTNFSRNVDMDVVYMNPVKILPYFGLGFWEGPEKGKYWIQEANFVNPMLPNFMDNFKNTWFCKLSPQENVNSSPFLKYEHDAIGMTMCGAFNIIRYTFFYMNYLPEWVTMLLVGLIHIPLFFTIMCLNYLWGFWSHLKYLGTLFSEMSKPPETSTNQLAYYLINSPKILFYMICYIIGAWFSIALSPFFITIYTFFKSISANYIVREKTASEPNKPLNIIDFIKNAFYYKKTFILILTMINLLMSATTYLGSSYMPGVIIAILILIFGLKILVPDGAENSLYPVLNQDAFPKFDIDKPFVDTDKSPANLCDKNAEPIRDTNPSNAFTKVTEKPVDVTKIQQQQQGGRKIKMPKQKMYNIRLV